VSAALQKCPTKEPNGESKGQSQSQAPGPPGEDELVGHTEALSEKLKTVPSFPEHMDKHSLHLEI